MICVDTDQCIFANKSSISSFSLDDCSTSSAVPNITTYRYFYLVGQLFLDFSVASFFEPLKTAEKNVVSNRKRVLRQVHSRMPHRGTAPPETLGGKSRRNCLRGATLTASAIVLDHALCPKRPPQFLLNIGFLGGEEARPTTSCRLPLRSVPDLCLFSLFFRTNENEMSVRSTHRCPHLAPLLKAVVTHNLMH